MGGGEGGCYWSSRNLTKPTKKLPKRLILPFPGCKEGDSGAINPKRGCFRVGNQVLIRLLIHQSNLCLFYGISQNSISTGNTAPENL